jgi:small multidrug resistance family-3 protein
MGRSYQMSLFPTVGLFFLTAVAEITGCYLPLLWLKGRASPWVLLPAAASLALFVWLLGLRPAGAGGVYVATAIAWLWFVQGMRPTSWGLVGSAVAILGMAIIVPAPRVQQ